MGVFGDKYDGVFEFGYLVVRYGRYSIKGLGCFEVILRLKEKYEYNNNEFCLNYICLI